MNSDDKKSPGRPRKYETDAERKKAYRERKKAEHTRLEKRAKRITELQGRIDNMEKKLMKSNYTTQQVPEAIVEVHEQIKDRSRKYTPSELMELELNELKRMRDSLQQRYFRNYYSPLLVALESAIMPSVDREINSRKIVMEDKSYEVLLADKLAKINDKTTPTTKTTILEYIQKAKKSNVEQKVENLSVKPSMMEKKIEDTTKHWQYLKQPYRADQLMEVLQELFQLYSVEAELARRERESSQERNIERLEKRLEEIEERLETERQLQDRIQFKTELDTKITEENLLKKVKVNNNDKSKNEQKNGSKNMQK